MTNKPVVVGASEGDAGGRLLALRMLRAALGSDELLINGVDIPNAVQGLLGLSGELLGKWWADVEHAGDPARSAGRWLDHEIRVEESRAR